MVSNGATRVLQVKKLRLQYPDMPPVYFAVTLHEPPRDMQEHENIRRESQGECANLVVIFSLPRSGTSKMTFGLKGCFFLCLLGSKSWPLEFHYKLRRSEEKKWLARFSRFQKKKYVISVLNGNLRRDFLKENHVSISHWQNRENYLNYNIFSSSSEHLNWTARALELQFSILADLRCVARWKTDALIKTKIDNFWQMSNHVNRSANLQFRHFWCKDLILYYKLAHPVRGCERKCLDVDNTK